MNFKTLASLVLLLATSTLFAQSNAPFSCKVNDLQLLAPSRVNDPALHAEIAAADAELEAFTRDFDTRSMHGGNAYTIPVVFHIIHTNGNENISDDQVFDCMRVLNDDFNKLNMDWQNVRPEFVDIVSDIGISFELAKKDPQGNCTKGITRTYSALTHVGDQDMKNLIQWPRNKYMNVWVCAYANGSAGYTYRPGVANGFPAGDGIVLQHNYTGSIGTSSIGSSRTLTHEVGHWLNLLHTWGDSNEPVVSSNCNGDDFVTDTPNTVGWTSCNLSGVTCGTLDNVENYMDYSYCSKMFTEGQATRMIAALNSGTAQRSNLWTPSNLSATGVSLPATLCAVVFTGSVQDICVGGSVSFQDLSYNAVTSRTWSFPGGIPSSSTDPDPVVTYDTPGVYSVTLNASDGSATLSTTNTNYITVQADPGAPVPFMEGFENTTDLNGPLWTVGDPDNNNNFEVTNSAAFSGSNSVRLVNTTAMTGQFDDFYSTTYDMSDAVQVTISFRYAYARRNITNDDRLRFYVSNNCGTSWSLRKQLRGSTDLNTAGGNVGGSFVPTSDQWGYAEVTNISSSYHTSDFRVKFEAEGDGGNNIYIDDININSTPVGVEEIFANGTRMLVMPNPAHGSAQLVIDLLKKDRISIEVLDITGRKIMDVTNTIPTTGVQRIDLPIAQLRSGVYMIRLQQGDNDHLVRFVVDR